MSANQIFIDTSYVVALINERDQYHARALEFADCYADSLLMVTDVVLLEIANALSRSYKTEAVQIIEDPISSVDVEVVRLSSQLFGQAFELYKTRQDKTWGLVDCISFVVMQSRNIRSALTFDQHFVQAGFQAIPLT